MDIDKDVQPGTLRIAHHFRHTVHVGRFDGIVRSTAEMSFPRNRNADGSEAGGRQPVEQFLRHGIIAPGGFFRHSVTERIQLVPEVPPQSQTCRHFVRGFARYAVTYFLSTPRENHHGKGRPCDRRPSHS